MDEEAIWVQEARDGDRAAFARLVERFQRPVYNLAYRMLGNTVEVRAQLTNAQLHPLEAPRVPVQIIHQQSGSVETRARSSIATAANGRR